MITWVLIKRIVELFGYSDDAIRAKIKKAVWLQGIHWRKAPDGRIFINIEAIQRWIEGKASEYVAIPVSKSTSRTRADAAEKR
jgi:hypothetical protein